MAILTPLDLEGARVVGADFALEVTSVEGLLAGSVNSNFALSTTSGRFFLRVVEEQGFDGAAREARLLALLSSRGVPTPEPLRRADGAGFTSSHAGKPAVVFPFVEGRSLAQQHVTRAAMRVVGAALAAVHAVGASLSPTELADVAGPSRFDVRAMIDRLDGLPRDLPDAIAPEIRAAEARLRAFFSSADARASTGESGLIHGDLFRDNVLFDGPKLVALLDFESASQGSIAFDVMVTALAWCFGDDLDEALVRAFFDGYATVRPAPAPTDLFAAGRLACARFATTRITDFELRPRGMGVYKDFRRFLRRLDAVERLGAPGLERLVREAAAPTS